MHVTPRDLRAAPGPWRPAVRGWDAVLVVDSARVLEAVAESLPGRVAVVCTDGPAGPVVLDLLERLRAGGTPLRFTLDFDAPGLALGTLLTERFGATAWRMGVEDYRRGVRSDLPPIAGRVVPPPWAPELAATITQAGRAVPAEQVLGELVESLAAELPADPVEAPAQAPVEARAEPPVADENPAPDAVAGDAAEPGQEQAGEMTLSTTELAATAH